MILFILFLISIPLLSIALSVPTFYLFNATDEKIVKFFRKRTIFGEIIKWVIFIPLPIFIFHILMRIIPYSHQDFIGFIWGILTIAIFSITTLHLFKGIEKLTIELFKKRTIFGEIIKWIVFAFIPFIIYFVFYFFIEIEGSHYMIIINNIKKFFSSFFEVGLLSFLYFYGGLFLTRMVILLIKRLITFILKKMKKQDKAETIADVMSWTLFMLIYLMPTFYFLFHLAFGNAIL